MKIIHKLKVKSIQGSHHQRAKILREIKERDDFNEEDLADEEEGNLNQTPNQYGKTISTR